VSVPTLKRSGNSTNASRGVGVSVSVRMQEQLALARHLQDKAHHRQQQIRRGGVNHLRALVAAARHHGALQARLAQQRHGSGGWQALPGVVAVVQVGVENGQRAWAWRAGSCGLGPGGCHGRRRPGRGEQAAMAAREVRRCVHGDHRSQVWQLSRGNVTSVAHDGSPPHGLRSLARGAAVRELR